MAVTAETSPLATKTVDPMSNQRLLSVDALRGFDMFWILGGDWVVRSFSKIHDSVFTRGLAAQMEHCEWAGFHFYDLIFPLFIFLAGVSLVFSISRMLERSGRAAAIKRIVLRSVILFLLGIFYMGGVADGFSKVYLAGVLQRIAGAYFFAALIFCFFRTRTMVGICISLLVVYWALMTFVPVPGIGAPSLAEPGRNLAHYVDVHYLPGQRFEGTLLSTLGAVANCLLGVLAGLLLKNNRVSEQQKVCWLTVGGVAGLLLGFAWAREFPIIKLLWTSSYVLVACGYGALLLALFHQIIEIWKCRTWAQPFVWIGMNALIIYLIAGVVNFRRLAERFVGGDVKIFLGSYSELVVSLVSLIFAFWLANFLHQKRIFLRL
jgi:predicted acyltransferase